jgi:hypothetical protein
MAVSCFACDYSVAPIPGLSSTNSPHATCWRCQVMTCVGHGQRDPNRPRFVCVLCDPQLLAASASVNQGASKPLARRFAADWGSADGDLLVKTIEDFLVRRPKYQGWLEQEVASRLDPDRRRTNSTVTGSLWSGTNDEAERLFLAAVAIVIRLEVPNQFLSVPMRLLVSSWR